MRNAYPYVSNVGAENGYTATVLDSLPGDEAGIKSCTIEIDGLNAYGYLKAEKGVHRLVRISPFNSAGKRMTSFASIEVMPELDDNVEVDIRPEDIKMGIPCERCGRSAYQ